ncbi:MAG TPA: LysR substrate-binding domain-containing protein [Burkholderiaceae bacterium]|nr:LysR substrate-binding domain-containing protein [Burkholderiaceae bacterium]
MDLKQIESFVRVAELGSFTRAAQMLDMTQPALSRQIRLLEVDLRQSLLVRNGRGAVPTEAGKLLLSHGRGILHQVARAREELGRVRGALAGRVAIGLPPSLARVLTVPLTRAFRAQLPEASLSITEGLSTQMQEWLVDGRLDIALLYNARASADIDISPLLDEDLLLVQARPPGLAQAPEQMATAPSLGCAKAASATTPAPAPATTASGGSSVPRQPMWGPDIPLAEVATMPLVIPSRPNAIRTHVETEMAQIGCRMRVALEIDGVSAILDLVADGAGAALLSRNAVASCNRPSAYQVRAVCDPPLRTRLFLAVSSMRPTTLTQQTTLALIRSTLGAVK